MGESQRSMNMVKKYRQHMECVMCITTVIDYKIYF